MDHENLNLSSGNYETRSSKLTDENAKCRVEFERSYIYLRLVAACSKIARTSVKARKSKLLSLVILRAQKRISEQALHWALVGSLRRDDQRTSVTKLHVSLKPRPNDRNMSTQHIATLLGSTCCVRLATMLRCVATCWVLLAQVWKWSNLGQQHPTRRNMSQQGGQTYATCCAQQCCNMLSWHVAIVWPRLKCLFDQLSILTEFKPLIINRDSSIGHVRYINILTWLRGFRVKILYLVLFSLYPSLFWELRDKRSLKNLQFWPESLGAMLEYWYIERGLLLFPVVVLLLKYISAFVANIMSFIEALFRLRICLFSYAYVFCRRESSKNWYCSTVLTLLLLTMVSANHIYCRQIARCHCVCLSHREFGSNLSKFRSKNLKANLPSSTRSLFNK